MSDDAEKTIETLREVTREAHAAIKDLRRVVREAKAARAELERISHEVFDERIAAEVEAGLAALGVAIRDATTEAQQAVFARFDKLTAELLGEARGQVPIADVYRAAVNGRPLP